MVNQPCMIQADAPNVCAMSLATDRSAVLIRFSGRAWTMLESATRQPNPPWMRHVAHVDGGMLMRVPIARIGSEAWTEVVLALSAVQQIVEALQWQDFEPLSDGAPEQLVWIDALHASQGASGITVLASPRFATCIRSASEEMFERVSVEMSKAECVMMGVEHVPLTRGASRYHGVLHLSVGADCACLGVSWSELPCDDQTGWSAHGHNLRFAPHILLVLVALAALEDECRGGTQ